MPRSDNFTAASRDADLNRHVQHSPVRGDGVRAVHWNISRSQNGCRLVPYRELLPGVKLNSSDTAILDSVWSAFVEVAAKFPDHEDVVMTLQYQAWYSRQCNILSQRSETPTARKI
jgi:hypothetical protein